MKKKFFPLMFIAAVTIGCSENEPNIEGNITTNSDDLVSINVYAGTTRGTDATTSTLETDSGYIELHIDDDGGISETYEFRYESSDWIQKDEDQLTWDKITFPANFYSMHDGSPLTGFTFGTNSATSASYPVTGASTDHKDLVYHASQLSSIPTGGTVSAYHKHALSKIHLYAATGTSNVYIARVNLVNIGSVGDVTITPLAATDPTTTNNVTWTAPTTPLTYLYCTLETVSSSPLNSDTNGSNPIINKNNDAPLMIIPQTTIAATVTNNPNSDSATISSTNDIPDSYIEVIYYMTDANGQSLVGYSAVSARSDATDYITGDQTKTLYVMGAFPLGKEFVANKVYDITLGLGADGSTGGKLLVDYYVDKDGNAITLTKKGDDEDSDTDDVVIYPVPIPEIDNGDDILAGSGDLIDILVSVRSWLDGDSITTEITTDDSTN